MNRENLNKWKELNQILEGHTFEIRRTIRKYYYYSTTFDGCI